MKTVFCTILCVSAIFSSFAGETQLAEAKKLPPVEIVFTKNDGAAVFFITAMGEANAKPESNDLAANLIIAEKLQKCERFKLRVNTNTFIIETGNGSEKVQLKYLLGAEEATKLMLQMNKSTIAMVHNSVAAVASGFSISNPTYK